MAQDNLGPLEAWQIREFPRELRRRIVDEAKRRQMTPGEFATGVFLAAADAGWEPTAARPRERDNRQDAEIAGGVASLIGAACQLAGTRGVPQALRKTANRAVEQNLTAFSRSLDNGASGAELVLEAPRQIRGQAAVVAGGDEPQQSFQASGMVEAEHG